MREKSWRVRVVTCLLLWEYHICTTLANRFVLRSLRPWCCLRKSAIIFWPRGESSDDDAGDGARSNARSREGVIGRRDFGFLDESAPEFVSLLHYIDAKGRKHTHASSILRIAYNVLLITIVRLQPLDTGHPDSNRFHIWVSRNRPIRAM